ncbi:MAG: branched-chain amino acid ABC transporter permease, partial [Eubacteriaceae bacterium]|nr:branched-chain amino acid ABC transporter permease [Eubacteriaceae bacterium]
MRVANKKNLIIAAALIVVFAIVQALRSAGIIGNFYEITIAQVCINIILAASLNLITGFTGQFSLGHAGFMSIGAYVCALSTLKNPTAGGFVAGVCLGALAATAVGLCIGIPTLRLKGDYLAIATLGVSEIIRIAFLNMKSTNGAAGLMNIPRLVDWKWLFWLTVFSVVLLRNFILSKHGRACVSIREDEIAAASIGINTTFYKIAAFAVGAFFAGIAGSMYASYFYFL